MTDAPGPAAAPHRLFQDGRFRLVLAAALFSTGGAIIKSTTLGAAIAYPEILQIFARTVLNQSGRAIETMTLVLGVFLAVNLLVSAAMNRWDRRLAFQGR